VFCDEDDGGHGLRAAGRVKYSLYFSVTGARATGSRRKTGVGLPSRSSVTR
jgi:hypothetical protein